MKIGEEDAQENQAGPAQPKGTDQFMETPECLGVVTSANQEKNRLGPSGHDEAGNDFTRQKPGTSGEENGALHRPPIL
jgi:hypothetical protein